VGMASGSERVGHALQAGGQCALSRCVIHGTRW
jgi:hypothetical protein